MQHPSIDFQQLFREEKVRARKERQRRNEKEQQESNQIIEAAALNTETAGELKNGRATSDQIANTEEMLNPTNTSVATKCSDKLVEIPDDWLSSSADNVAFPIRLDRVHHRVSRDPPSIYYIPNFLPSSAQELLIAWLLQLPHVEKGNNNENSNPNGKWTTLRYARRRVALMDGILSLESQEQQPDQQQSLLPRPIQQLAQVLVDAGIFSEEQPPNHVLINEYFEPTQGIMAHTDGPLYAPTTATISIGGGDVLLNFTPRRPLGETAHTSQTIPSRVGEAPRLRQVWLQGNGSLVVFTEDAYTSYLHGIDEHVQVEEASSTCANAAPGTPIVRGYRVSLTFRHKLLPGTRRIMKIDDE
jgi:alkylated DNA repair protein alkB family protein 6